MYKFFYKPISTSLKDEKEYQKMVRPKTNPSNEYYRVGATSDGLTTLTLMSTDGFSCTLTLNKVGCEQLIRMIRATYISDKEINNGSNPQSV